MGLRFRKSVKICKGVKVNFSKSGASLSLGGRGHSVNLGGKGARITAGIPGTGLSYSTKIGGHSKKHSTQKHVNRAKTTTTQRKPVKPQVCNYLLRMDEKGEVQILTEQGFPITDAALLRGIKQSPQFAMQKQQLESQRQAQIAEIISASESENDKFINIYKLATIVDPKEAFEKRLVELQPHQYVPKQFLLPMPTYESVQIMLRQEAKRCVQGSIFAVKQKRDQYVAENLQMRYNNAMMAWENQRKEFLESEERQKSEEEAEFFEEYAEQKEFLQNLIDGDEDTISEIFDEWIENCQLPVEIDVNYEWKRETNTMMLDVDLPEIEDIPENKMTLTQAGNLKEKKKTQGEIREEYATLVFGLAVFVSSNAFNVSPAIDKIIISGYTQRRNKEGDLKDDYIYSIKFTRNMFEKKNVALVEPKGFCMTTENRCNMTNTSLFKAIQPFET